MSHTCRRGARNETTQSEHTRPDRLQASTIDRSAPHAAWGAKRSIVGAGCWLGRVCFSCMVSLRAPMALCANIFPFGRQWAARRRTGPPAGMRARLKGERPDCMGSRADAASATSPMGRRLRGRTLGSRSCSLLASGGGSQTSACVCVCMECGRRHCSYTFWLDDLIVSAAALHKHILALLVMQRVLAPFRDLAQCLA